ncbi:MAG: HDOD domain-containing protein [Phycisphaerales bacterium]|nr:MAG: HDOD domain-containing protein [Phycisphaerales bacterium]
MQQGAESLKRELQSLFNRAKLPTGPAVAARILALIDDPSSTSAQFGEVIEADAALAGRLLEMANSEMYQQSVPITTIHRAVTLIGLRQLRLLVLGFELVNHVGRLGEGPFDIQSFWQESLLRASLSQEIAACVVPSLADEAFVVGLLQDCGIPMLIQILGRGYAELFAAHRGSPPTFHAHEQRFFPYSHVDAISALSSIWKLPACIRDPLGMQHERRTLGKKPTTTELLGAVSYLVGSIGFFADDQDRSVDPGLRDYARRELHLTDEDLEESLSSSAERYRAITALFEAALPQDFDITELLAEAKRRFAIEAADLQRDLRSVQNDLARLVTERSNLAQALAQYRERASADPLTGILNRGALVEMTDNCLRLATEQKLPVAAYFLDIDGFKRINDEFGHAAGDQVLKDVSDTIVQTLGDAIVGRYGGEEFVAVIPGVTGGRAEELGEALVRAVRHGWPQGPDVPRSVTCSLGVVWAAPESVQASGPLFSAADELMYAAKRKGKNCLCFGAFDARRPVCLYPSEVAAVDQPVTAPQPESDHSGASFEDLRRAVDVLDGEKLTAVVEQRKHERQSLLSPCVLCCFADPTLRLHSENAYARNISPGGLAVVVARRLARGDLVEITIEYGRKRLYLAGCVAYCRRLDSGVHDVGIQLAQQSHQPVFSDDPVHAAHNIDWIAQALDQRYSNWRDFRASA